MLVIGTQLENLTSRKDGTWKMTLGTQELTPAQVSELSMALNKFLFTALKLDEFKTEESEFLENLETGFEDTKKSQSKRLKSVLFLNWKQNDEGFSDSNNYYNHHMEKIIEHFKNKLD